MLLNTRPAEYIKAPAIIARLSPNFSAKAPKIGCPMPHARFWMAMANENSARGQLKLVAMGIWKTP